MPPGIPPKTMKQFTEVASAGLQSVAVPVWANRNLEEVYNSIHGGFPNITRLDTGAIWTEEGVGFQVSLHDTIRIMSRGSFPYARLEAMGQWVTMVAGTVQGIGLGGNGTLPDPGYAIMTFGAAAYLVTREMDGTYRLDQFSGLPGDYNTVDHVYGVNLLSGRIEYVIDGIIVGVCLYGMGNTTNDFPVWTNNPPYNLIGIPGASLPSSMPSLLALDSDTDILLPFPPHYFSISEGEPSPPRVYQCYTENTATEWQNLATAGATMISHPIPVWGYPDVTVMFMADAAGTLQVQTWWGDGTNGGWYDLNAPGGVVVVAEQPYIFRPDGIYSIIRLVYEPTNGDNIAYAQVHMR